MMTILDLQNVARSKGLDRLAELVGKYPDIVEPYLGKITEKLVAKGLWKPPYEPVSVSVPRKTARKHDQGSGGEYAPVASRELTDREGWTMLADLVDTALATEPVELREALKREFLAEAARA
jgi:hypothetical protein